MNKLGKVTTGQRMKHVWHSPWENTISLYKTNNVEALFKRLGSLKIINKALEEITEWIDEEMSKVLVNRNKNAQTVMLKSIVWWGPCEV